MAMEHIPREKKISSQVKLSKKSDKQYLCFCRIISLMVYACRVYGICPIVWQHKEKGPKINSCSFHVSKIWLIYSFILCVTFIVSFYGKIGFEISFKFVSESSYHLFSILLQVFGIINSKKLVMTLNRTQKFCERGLLCAPCKKSLLRNSRIFFVLLALAFFTQWTVFIFMAFYDETSSKFSIRDIFIALTQNVAFMFYYEFCVICGLYVGFFACFETAMHQILFRNENHDIDRDQLTSLIAMCDGDHSTALQKDFILKTRFEEIDSLRRLHEFIRLGLSSANKAFNPQIPMLLTVEIGVLVMHLYSVITFLYAKVKTPALYTMNFLNLVFVTLHSVGLLIFIFSTQGIKRTQIGPMKQISDYSSKHLTPEEFAQIRLFSIKLSCSPVRIMAARFCEIDIKLLATIASYVTTYLLIALQFSITALKVSQ